MAERWSIDRANDWWSGRSWPMGCNFTPSTAINQLEMWQADSFDLPTIEAELAMAASIGMNAVRVYLHDLLWADDAAGFADRIDQVLAAADRHGIATMLVLFDSCWHPEPALGPQPNPTPDVHNSGWVQSPGIPALRDPAQHARLADYVRGVVGRFRDDRRVMAWDIWNEPDNGADVSLCDPAQLEEKAALVLPLLEQAFGWAREARPEQPLTSAIWLGDWSAPRRMTALQRAQVGLSDIVSFHNYGDAEDFARRIGWLRRYRRPLLCTEYMARPAGSTFEAILPIAHGARVGAFCWGLVRGKTQTHLPWASWQAPDPVAAANRWFHDIFDVDGIAHDETEIEFLRMLAEVDRRAPHWPIVGLPGTGEADAADVADRTSRAA